MKKRVAFIGILLSILVISTFIFKDELTKQFFESKPSSIPKGVSLDSIKKESEEKDIVVVAKDLSIPWEIEFINKETLLITERPGNLLILNTDSKEVIKVDGVEHIGEGGLLGMTLHPNFEKNNWVYLYLTTRTGNGIENRVERYTLISNRLTNRKIILKGIKGAPYHDGGRIDFGPEGYLYVTTGDAGNKQSAQDINSLNGKILRVDENGSFPKDNPFENEVYSYGHRNAQGLAWDEKGNLWSTEHGPSGLSTGYDELNLIQKGGNYGWPTIKGDEKKEGLIPPIIHSGSNDTWAPAGLEYYNGSLFFTGLRGAALYEAKVVGNNVVSLKEHFKNVYGRLRAVKLGPNNYLYLTTSNTDGRGNQRPGDDKLLQINLDVFTQSNKNKSAQ